MQPVTDGVEPEGVRIMLIRNQCIGKQFSKDLTALLAEGIRVIGDMVARIVEDGQCKIKME